jgi:hypothetical protein
VILCFYWRPQYVSELLDRTTKVRCSGLL